MAEQEDVKDPEFEEAINWNLKRTGDEYQNESLASSREAQKFVALVSNDTHALIHRIQQNAASQDNIAMLQAIGHRDILLDKILRLEPSEAAAQSSVLPTYYRDAIKALVVEALKEALNSNANPEPPAQ